MSKLKTFFFFLNFWEKRGGRGSWSTPFGSTFALWHTSTLFTSFPLSSSLHFSHSPLFDHTSRLSSILPLLPSLPILLLSYLSSASHFSTPSLSDLKDPHLTLLMSSSPLNYLNVKSPLDPLPLTSSTNQTNGIGEIQFTILKRKFSL